MPKWEPSLPLPRSSSPIDPITLPWSRSLLKDLSVKLWPSLTPLPTYPNLCTPGLHSTTYLSLSLSLSPPPHTSHIRAGLVDRSTQTLYHPGAEVHTPRLPITLRSRGNFSLLRSHSPVLSCYITIACLHSVCACSLNLPDDRRTATFMIINTSSSFPILI